MNRLPATPSALRRAAVPAWGHALRAWATGVLLLALAVLGHGALHALAHGPSQGPGSPLGQSCQVCELLQICPPAPEAPPTPPAPIQRVAEVRLARAPQLASQTAPGRLHSRGPPALA